MQTRTKMFLVALTLPLLHTQVASAYCASAEGPWHPSLRPVPVYINTNVSTELCVSGECTNSTDIRISIEAALDEFFDSSGAAEVVRTATMSTSATPGTFIPGAIHIYATDNCYDTIASTAWNTDGNGYIDRVKIRLCKKYFLNPVRWKSYPNSSSTYDPSFFGVLMHELGHAHSLWHPSQECNQNIASVIGTTVWTAHRGHHLYKDDMDWARTLYGTRSTQLASWVSGDAGSWTSAPNGPASATGALSRVSSCNTSTSNALSYVSYPDVWAPHWIRLTKHQSGAWSDIGPLFASSYSHTGTACAGGDDLLVSFLTGYDSSDGTQDVYAYKTTNEFASWTTHVLASGTDPLTGRTQNTGTAATYDPKTGNYIVLWRSSTDEIVSRVVGSSESRLYETSPSTYLRSSDSPSIACGPASLGTNNCLIAWTDTNWQRSIRWAHGRVAFASFGWEFVIGTPIYTWTNIWAYGTPSVAYFRHSSHPWAMTFHRGGSYAFTFRKSSSTSASWYWTNIIFESSKITAPTLGSRCDLFCIFGSTLALFTGRD